jgi:hypothetical protein
MPELVGTDTNLTTVDLYPLLLALAWVAAIVGGDLATLPMRAPYGGVPAMWVKEATFWSRVSQWTTNPGLLKPTDLEPLWEGLRFAYQHELIADFARLQLCLRDACERHVTVPAGSSTDILLRGAVCAIGILHAAVTSPGKTTLADFTRRFELQRRIRKLQQTGLPGFDCVFPLESVRVAETLDHLCSSSRLIRVELRKTVTAPATPGSRSLKDAVLDDVRNHLIGTREYLKRSEQRLVVQMPIGFLRRRDEDGESLLSGSSGREHRFPLLPVLALAQAVAQILTDKPMLRDFIGGLDVAGPEDACPNWVFAVAYEYLDYILRQGPIAHHPLVYSIHAGEYFGCPLQGLRNVAECLQFRTRITRIGHGLALDAGLPTSGRRTYAYLAAEVLDDLCWSAHFAAEHQVRLPLDIDRALAHWLPRVAQEVFGHAVDRSTLRSWYSARFSKSALAAAGVSSLQGWPLRENIMWRPGIESGMALRYDDLNTALLAAFLFKGEFMHVGGQRPIRIAYRPDRPLTRGKEAMAALSAQLYEILRPVVVSSLAGAPDVDPVVIESCPSSNLAIGGYAGFDEHPLRQFLDDGLRCTVNTDDPAVFVALVEEELIALSATQRYSTEELAMLQRYGLAHTAIGMPEEAQGWEYYDSLCQAANLL